MCISKSMYFKPDKVFDGRNLHADLWVEVSQDLRCKIVKKNILGGAKSKKIRGILSPGFVDLQVNGGGGALFNNDPTPHTLSVILAAHRHFGTTAILPTIITDAQEVLAKAVDAVIAAKNNEGIIGIHIEGPHISTEKSGIHAAQFIRPFDSSTLRCVKNLRSEDIPVMITVAPEVVSMKNIAALSETGAVVSLGHTNASADLTQMALANGARAFTHLFNAMPPMINRKPCITTAAINSLAYTGIIGDGFHVDDEMLKVAIRARPISDRVFIVSDGMPTVNGPSSFELYDQVITLNAGRLLNAKGTLSGGHTSIANTLNRLVTILEIEVEEVLKMAISNPAELIGLPYLANANERSAKDLICLDTDLTFLGYFDKLISSGF